MKKYALVLVLAFLAGCPAKTEKELTAGEKFAAKFLTCKGCSKLSDNDLTTPRLKLVKDPANKKLLFPAVQVFYKKCPKALDKAYEQLQMTFDPSKETKASSADTNRRILVMLGNIFRHFKEQRDSGNSKIAESLGSAYPPTACMVLWPTRTFGGRVSEKFTCEAYVECLADFTPRVLADALEKSK